MRDVTVADTTIARRRARDRRHRHRRTATSACSSDGDEFDLDRANADQHLTFGYGPHVCPGATLARVEARIALTAFFDQFPPGAVRLAPGFEFENVPTFFEVGPRELPVDLG